MKHIFITIFALLAMCAGAAAQDTWFCGEPGTKLSYVKKEAKNGAEFGYDYIIKDKVVADGRTTISFDVVIPGQPSAGSCSVWSENGMFHSDASAALGQFGAGLNAKGSSPALPENPTAGAALPDCSISIDALMLTSEFKKIHFTKEEEVSVPAGTFKCWCLEYDVTDTVMGLKARNHVKQWLAKGVGEVKTVTQDMGGRVVAEKVLKEIAK